MIIILYLYKNYKTEKVNIYIDYIINNIYMNTIRIANYLYIKNSFYENKFQ